MKTYIRRQQRKKKFKHQDIKQKEQRIAVLIFNFSPALSVEFTTDKTYGGLERNPDYHTTFEHGYYKVI